MKRSPAISNSLRDDQRSFLTVIASRFREDHYLLLRFIQDKALGNDRVLQIYPATPGGVEQALDSIFFWNHPGLMYNVFVSPFPRTALYGGARTVVVATGVFCDFDCGEGLLKDGTGRAKYASKDAAEAALDLAIANGTVPYPSMIVDSGHGLHTYTLYDVPLCPEDLLQYRRITVGMASALGTDGNVTRSLDVLGRVPGTWNYKKGLEPVLSRLIECTDTSYPIEHFPKASDEDLRRFTSKSTRRLRSHRSDANDVHMSSAPPMVEVLAWVLHATGIPFVRSGGGAFIRLRYCPYCSDAPTSGGSANTAWVHPLKLTLHCYRDSCPLSKRGAELEEWLLLVVSTLPDLYAGLLPRPAAEAEEVLRKLIDPVMEIAAKGELPILQVEFGGGKTTLCSKHLVHNASIGHGATMLVPTHELAEEVTTGMRAFALDQGLDVRVIHAESKSRCCIHKAKLREWSHKMLSWNSTMCSGCDQRERCPPLIQFDGIDRARTVVVAVHAYLPQLIWQGMLGEYVIIDEACSSFERDQAWSKDDLRVIRNDRRLWSTDRHAAADFCLRLLDQAEEHHTRLKRESLEEPAKGSPAKFGLFIFGDDLKALISQVETETAVTLSGARDYSRRRSPPRPSRKAVLNGVPGAGTVQIDFDDLIDNLEYCAVYFESDKTRPVFVRFTQSMPKVPVPVVLLDATASSNMPTTEALFKDRSMRLIPVRVKEPSCVRRVFMKTTSYQSKRLRQAPSRTRTAFHHNLEQLKPYVKNWWGERANAPRWGLITSMAFEETALAVLEDSSIEVTVHGHYGAIRGLNTFSDVDVLLLVGDYVPNINRCGYEAFVLGIDTKERIRSISMSEAQQAAGRARAIRRTSESPLLIVSLSDRYLLDAEYDELIETSSGRIRGDRRRELEDFVEHYLFEMGFVAARLFTPEIVHETVNSEVGQSWQENSTDSQLCPTSILNTGASTDSDKKLVRRAVNEVAERSGATSLQVALLDGHGRKMTVWELRGGAYDEWLKKRGGAAHSAHSAHSADTTPQVKNK